MSISAELAHFESEFLETVFAETSAQSSVKFSYLDFVLPNVIALEHRAATRFEDDRSRRLKVPYRESEAILPYLGEFFRRLKARV